MADNVTLDVPAQSGAVLASDDIGGIHYQRIKPAFGVDGSATDVSHTNPLPTIDGFVAPTVATATTVSLAAGTSTDLDSAQISSGTTGKLVSVLMSATVPLKGEVKTVQNGVASSALAVFFSRAGEATPLTLPSREFITQAEDATAGLDGFRLTVTNLDTTAAVDVYATFFYDEV